eukprot:272813-Prymnesium_polylepis.1
MPTTVYKDPRTCVCGHSTINPSNWSQHKKRCKSITDDRDVRIATLEKQLEDTRRDAREQLSVKDEQMKEQLAAKDEQIKELIQVAKKPRTVNNTTNNRYVVEQHINVFGKESIDHISPQQIQALLADPANAVP